jgi:hypothetical protein
MVIIAIIICTICLSMINLKAKILKFFPIGLFADRDYKEDELVTLYLGNIMADTDTDIKDRSYLAKWNGFLIDGKYNWQGLRGLGRFINCPSEGQKANCYWSQVTVPGDPGGLPLHRAICASRKINRGEEFLISYGSQYWERFDGVPTSSQRKKPGRPFKLGASRFKAPTRVSNNTNCQTSVNNLITKRKRRIVNKFNV